MKVAVSDDDFLLFPNLLDLDGCSVHRINTAAKTLKTGTPKETFKHIIKLIQFLTKHGKQSTFGGIINDILYLNSLSKEAPTRFIYRSVIQLLFMSDTLKLSSSHCLNCELEELDNLNRIFYRTIVRTFDICRASHVTKY